MTRLSAILASALLACAIAPAATISTTMTVKGSGALTGTTFTGTADLTGIGTNLALTGTFAASTSSPGSYNAIFVISVNSTDKLNVNITIPAAILLGSATASGQITGGSGAYAGATGSFPSMPGTGAISGTSLTLSFSGAGTIVTGGTPPAPVPTITAVQDAASNTPGIAQGSIFIVKGTTLSPSGFTSYAPPRPTQPSGVKVTFTPTAGGTGTDAYIVYLYNQGGVNQIAAILPSNLAAGNYNVTVTNGTVSAPFAAQVVTSKIGLFTQDSSGTGLASVQNYISAGVVDLNRLTTGSVSGITISPAKPGQPVIAYGTGLGAYIAGDNSASPVFDFRASATIQAVVGGVSIPVDYAGRAGYAGEDQINFTLPANIPTGCSVSLQISVNGKLSPATSIAIAPDANSSACVIPGYTTSQLQKLDQGGTITAGGFAITQFAITVPQIGNVKSNSVSGGFTKLTGFQLSSAAQANVSVIQQGSCQVITSSGGSGTTAGGSLTYLDAGNVTVTGPAGSSLTNTPLNKSTDFSYSLSSTEGFAIPGQASFSLPAGTYSLAGAGGNDVGTFNTSISVGSPLAVTGGLPSSVTRSNALTLNWTGGNASDLVEIVGGSSTSTGTGTNVVTTSTTFICLTTAGQKTFTVPASILQQLPATSGTNTGILEVASGTVGPNFSASLKAGGSIDAGTFSSFVGTGATVTWQ
uniref:Uncharacterized protein n=1 Tax=Solibacter usitatus (strain Ellin6076) TaxID=234267 RepID=Q027H3_SOLUE